MTTQPTTMIPLYNYDGPYSADLAAQQTIKLLLAAEEFRYLPQIRAQINLRDARWLIV
jgi:hypothetical protein